MCVDANDNELAYLEAIHFFVEVLDQFFGNVCELDLVFNFYKVCFLCVVVPLGNRGLCVVWMANALLRFLSGLCHSGRGFPCR